MNHQVSINVLGSDLIYAATTFAGTSEWGASRRTGRVSLAVRRVCQHIQIVSVAHVPLEHAIERNSITEEFVWELKRHLYVPFNDREMGVWAMERMI